MSRRVQAGSTRDRITARFPSRCAACRGRIAPGDTIARVLRRWVCAACDTAWWAWQNQVIDFWHHNYSPVNDEPPAPSGRAAAVDGLYLPTIESDQVSR